MTEPSAFLHDERLDQLTVAPDESELTALSDEEIAAIDAELLVDEAELDAALSELLAPPADLPARVSDRVRDSLLDREVMATFADLFGTGWRVGQEVLRPLEDDA